MGDRIRRLRLSKGLTQEELGKRVGLQRAAINKYEKGNVENMKRTVIGELSSFFGVTPAYLMALSNHDYDINDVFDRLDDKNKADVYNYAETTLKKQSYFENKKNSLPFTESSKTYEFPFKGSVSAGTGEWMDDEINEMITLNCEPPAHADFALKVNGDSMQPLFENGQLIFVDVVEDPAQVYSNQIVIADLNGEAFVKKIVFEQSGCRLVSLNKKYEDKIVTENDAFYVRGIVVL
ncbi:XRE family transcriptional regulator [Ligilactobacillus murinus]|nr:XRE family transcriptional regulator [Ligilactobacillus murinus]